MQALGVWAAEDVARLFRVLVSSQVHKRLVFLLACVGSGRAQLFLVVRVDFDNLFCKHLFFGQSSFRLGDVTHHLEAYLCNEHHNVVGRKYLTETDRSFCADLRLRLALCGFLQIDG